MGRGATVKLLLEHEGVDPDSKDYEGRTPLLWAAWSGDEVVVKLLLANDGVDPDSKDSKYGRTPLSWAAKQGHEAVVKLLLARDGVNPGSRDKFCRTPLSYAAGYGHEAVLKLLLVKNNVDLDIKDKFGLAPRSLAAKRGNPGIVQLLVEKHNENDKLIREEYMQVVNPPAGDHQNHIDCDVCMLSIPDRESHYHCRTCIDGDFDICQKCVASGYSCLDYSHKLVNRIVKDSTMVEVPD
ncbi:ankyrin [Zopfia rhizophila CBS 207.26]|uniref:Ankyrin n=1 Tax=Zopfia rhizophila CBS 207.26 TaxID=1314779 RepID=A0A6A6DWU8_9PEZI|nr:ankyrin [Zopfia rhizophila CBS 207.26]